MGRSCLSIHVSKIHTTALMLETDYHGMCSKNHSGIVFMYFLILTENQLLDNSTRGMLWGHFLKFHGTL
jgi:hypothetical protein